MSAPPRAPDSRDPWLWHLALIALLSLAYESRFLHFGLNTVDEGWPLYAAMRLQQGGSLYQDTFFVFPPGHVLSAWLGRTLGSPGVIETRVFYSLFNTAACLSLYAVGRRLMPAHWALLGAALLAVAAPRSHNQHLLFGYRYVVFSLLALLAFERRFRTGDRRWMFAAGVLLGLQLCFRPTPALATALALGVGLLAFRQPLPDLLSDGLRLSAGVFAVALPVVLWLGASAGFDTLWREMVERPIAMTLRQQRPVPPLEIPAVWKRRTISLFFTALLFPLCAILYSSYALALVADWLRSLVRGEPFRRAFLTVVVVFGATFYTRSLGRSDEPHLMSAIPPFCLLAAHAAGVVARRLPGRRTGAPRRVGAAALGIGIFAAWVFLSNSDRVFEPKVMGLHPVESLGGATRINRQGWFDDAVEAIRRHSGPDDTVLVLAPTSLLLVVSERLGPGWADVIMPGTFLDPLEELAFIRRLEAAPPRLVVYPRLPFDGMEERSVNRDSPRLMRWVDAHYDPVEISPRYVYLAPVAPGSPGADPRRGG